MHRVRWGTSRHSECNRSEATTIECGLCSNHLAGKEADAEWNEIELESRRNLTRASRGQPAKYRPDARFVAKVIPDMPRDKTGMDARIRATLKLPRNKGDPPWLSRRDVPAGEAGFLYLQAKLLAAGARSLPYDTAINRWHACEEHPRSVSAAQASSAGSGGCRIIPGRPGANQPPRHPPHIGSQPLLRILTRRRSPQHPAKGGKSGQRLVQRDGRVQDRTLTRSATPGRQSRSNRCDELVERAGGGRAVGGGPGIPRYRRERPGAARHGRGGSPQFSARHGTKVAGG